MINDATPQGLTAKPVVMRLLDSGVLLVFTEVIHHFTEVLIPQKCSYDSSKPEI